MHPQDLTPAQLVEAYRLDLMRRTHEESAASHPDEASRLKAILARVHAGFTIEQLQVLRQQSLLPERPSFNLRVTRTMTSEAFERVEAETYQAACEDLMRMADASDFPWHALPDTCVYSVTQVVNPYAEKAADVQAERASASPVKGQLCKEATIALDHFVNFVARATTDVIDQDHWIKIDKEAVRVTGMCMAGAYMWGHLGVHDVNLQFLPNQVEHIAPWDLDEKTLFWKMSPRQQRELVALDYLSSGQVAEALITWYLRSGTPFRSVSEITLNAVAATVLELQRAHPGVESLLTGTHVLRDCRQDFRAWAEQMRGLIYELNELQL